METAKVDIRKLQLLNDRINQMMEVLNQVRLSVHGIQHTATTPSPIGPYGYPVTATPGFAAAGYPQQLPYFGHATPWQGTVGYGQGGGFGIGHSPWTGAMTGLQGVTDTFGTTDMMTARIQQTFPFLFAQQSPFGQSPFGVY